MEWICPIIWSVFAGSMCVCCLSISWLYVGAENEWFVIVSVVTAGMVVAIDKISNPNPNGDDNGNNNNNNQQNPNMAEAQF